MCFCLKIVASCAQVTEPHYFPCEIADRLHAIATSCQIAGLTAACKTVLLRRVVESK